jgi:hypothetical protein
MAWSDKFSHPIKWGASTLRTLHDARDYILKLPQSKQALPAWQAAVEALRQAAEHGGVWLELSRIGVMHALLGPSPEPGLQEIPRRGKGDTKHKSSQKPLSRVRHRTDLWS